MQRQNRPSQPPPPPSAPLSSSSPSTKPPPSSSTTSTNNDPNYFTEENLPSCRPTPKSTSTMTPQTEKNTRRRTCRFLQEVCRKLSLGATPRATSFVMFHRFYAVHSFAEHNRFEVAMACVLLAAKTEECTRKLNHVIREAWRLKHQSEKSGGGSSSSGNADEEKNVDKNGYLNEKCEQFVKLKERVLLLERVVLHTIGFELSIDHPFTFIFKQVRNMTINRQIEYVQKPTPTTTSTTDSNQMLKQSLTKSAVDFANDSLHTTLCLQFPPEYVALTCIYMSAQFNKVRPTGGGVVGGGGVARKWLDILVPDGGSGHDFGIEELTSIALQIMELIADKRDCKDLELFKTIRADLNTMKKEEDVHRHGNSPKRPRLS